MKVITFTYQNYHELLSNTYLLIDNDKCVVIDPSVNNDGIINYIKNHSLSLKGVLLTHCHFDHIQGVDRLIDEFKCPLYIHENDVDGLKDINLNCSIYNENGFVVKVKSLPTPLYDGEILSILDNSGIKVIHTPFHSMGSSCFYVEKENILFSGDTLFKLSVGRDDLPGSKPRLQYESLNKLISLPDECKIYPGHGSSSTIGYEKKYNRFIKRN